MSRFTYPSGDVYDGSWDKNGQKHGTGKLKFVDGSVYEGKFSAGMFSGLGVLKHADGSKYEGEFSNGKFAGYGVYTRHDGWTFQGQFQDGKVNGYGSVTNTLQNLQLTLEGFFEGNKLTKREKSTEYIMKGKRASAQARLVKANKNLTKHTPKP